MTKTYAITEEQRQLLLDCLYIDVEEESTAHGVLKSLPLITGEHVGWVREWSFDGESKGYQLYDISEEVDCARDVKDDGGICKKLYTSPQPLTQISADDVSHCHAIEYAAQTLAECMDYPWTHMPEQGRKEMRTHAHAIVSAFIKHKGDTE